MENPKPTTMEELFGPVISTYSQAQAVEDGQLVRIDESVSKRAGVKWPVLVTRALFDGHLDCDTKKKSGDTVGRVLDMLSLFTIGVRLGKGDGGTMHYRVKFGSKVVRVKAVCGPADDGSPCIVFMFPEED